MLPCIAFESERRRTGVADLLGVAHPRTMAPLIRMGSSRMDSRSVGATVTVITAGVLVFITAAYPPVCGWGKDFWGDVATWLSAIGTLAAVIVALSIANAETRRALAERQRREVHRTRLTVISLSQYLVPMLNEIRHAQRVLPSAVAFAKENGPPALAEQLRLSDVDRLPRGAELDDIPLGLAEAITRAVSVAATYNVIINQLKDTEFDEFSPEFWEKQLDLSSLLDHAQRAVAKVADILVVQEPALSAIEWRKRGDGSQLV